MNPSGKKEAVVICCLTTEVVKVVEPVKFYEAARVHIISYPNTGEGSPDEAFYNTFLEEACRQIRAYTKAETFVDCANIMDYQEMLRTIINIVAEERIRDENSIIYVNISSGTPEYIAGAMLAAMQDNELIAFSVRSKTRSMGLDEAIKAYTVDGKPTGRTSSVCDPTMVMTFGPEVPSDKHVACLEVFKGQEIDNRHLNFNEIIEALKEKGIWDYIPEVKKTRTDDLQKERMFLRRNYITPMLDKGWVVENHQKRNKFDLTTKGQAIVAVYGKG
ncbi:MAG: hypothetical protein IKQ14_04210 [Candidatus Methanomethylophilaceae archaeon]|nr:hypothetical protein [Candidatus Methanomethylophilaceae archaeon]MBR6213497.1 hypothetical protein [Candidatus Methanomethylophilaceae archaeon]